MRPVNLTLKLSAESLRFTQGKERPQEQAFNNTLFFCVLEILGSLSMKTISESQGTYLQYPAVGRSDGFTMHAKSRDNQFPSRHFTSNIHFFSLMAELN